MYRFKQNVLRSNKGQGAVEYALITLAVVAILALTLGSNSGIKAAISKAFTTATTTINTINS